MIRVTMVSGKGTYLFLANPYLNHVQITCWHKMPYNCTVEGQYQLQGTLSVPSIRDSTIFSHIVKLLHGNVHKETSPSNIFTSKLA